MISDRYFGYYTILLEVISEHYSLFNMAMMAIQDNSQLYGKRGRYVYLNWEDDAFPNLVNGDKW